MCCAESTSGCVVTSRSRPEKPLTRRTTPRPSEDSAGADGSYPMCGACGHHTSAVVAEHCTVMVPDIYGDGPGNFSLGYCGCRCIDDPAVKVWLELPREAP